MIRGAVAGLALACTLAAPAVAQSENCRLALLLAMDISSSVSAEEDHLQRAGLAAALLAPDVAEAIFANSTRHVALSVIEWSGTYQQSVLLDWTLIADPASLQAAAQQLADSRRSYDEYPTAMGFALGYAHAHFRTAPACDRMTLDISGDGLSNEGFDTEIAYATYDYSGIIVNGLVIGAEPSLLRYYRQNVIRGPGAFVQTATDYRDFERAMTRKLLREVGLAVAGLLP